MMVDEHQPDDWLNSDEAPMYDEWIGNRRMSTPPPELTDRIMVAVNAQAGEPRSWVRLADRVDESQAARWAACGAAMLVGCLPFMFVAYVAQSLVF